MSSLLDKKNILEYPDAPSGSVFFYNYKEPLMRFDQGYGYQGALIFDADSEKIQCHFCGDWYDTLGPHLKKEHNMFAAEYKRDVGLNQSTALINEKIRQKLIATGLEARKKNLRSPRKVSKATRLKISETLKEVNSEKQNLRNTCPEQLLSRLTKKYNQLGRTPKESEIGFYETLVKVWGSMERACELAGIPYRKPGQTTGQHYKWSYAKAVEQVSAFYQENKRFPRYVDGKELWYGIKKYNYTNIKREVLASMDTYVKPPARLRFTNDDLIKFLRDFAKNNGRKPSSSDCKRGLLPNASKYIYRFGSWPKALAIAFPV